MGLIIYRQDLCKALYIDLGRYGSINRRWLHFPATTDRSHTMQQSHAYQDTSLALTTSILDAKARKNLSWQDLTDGTGLGLAYVTAALLGQHPLPEAAARVIGEKLELDADSVARLQ